MKRKPTISKTNIAIIALLVAIFLLIMFKSLLQPYISSIFGIGVRKGAGESVAWIEEYQGNVKLKPVGQLNWVGVSKGELLYLQDSISTFSDSWAIIKFKMGYSLKVEANSTILIEMTKSKEGEIATISMTVLRGIVQAAKSKHGAKGVRIKIKAGDKEFESQDSDFGVRVNDDESQDIWVTKGNVVANTKDGKSTIRENERRNLKKKRKTLNTIIEEVSQEIAMKTRGKKKLEERKLEQRGLIGLTPLQKNRVITGLRRKIEMCYNKSQRRQLFNGRTYVTMKIRNDGKITNMDISTRKAIPVILERCIKRYLRTAKFPKFKGKKFDDANFTMTF